MILFHDFIRCGSCNERIHPLLGWVDCTFTTSNIGRFLIQHIIAFDMTINRRFDLSKQHFRLSANSLPPGTLTFVKRNGERPCSQLVVDVDLAVCFLLFLVELCRNQFGGLKRHTPLEHIFHDLMTRWTWSAQQTADYAPRPEAMIINSLQTSFED